MMRPLLALRTWLASAAFLYTAACTHSPDVVANLEASSNAGPAGSAGTTGGAAGQSPAQAPGSGAGGTFEVAGTHAHGDAGVPPNDGGGRAGSDDTSTDECPLDDPTTYWRVKMIVDDGCKLDPTQYPFVRRFVEEAPPPTPMGETHTFGPCDFTGGLPYFDGAKLVLCDNACDAARKWIADQECEVMRCLGLGSCDTEDAGS